MKFYKILIITIIVIMIVGCTDYTIAKKEPNIKRAQITCGGWYPLFFKTYEHDKIDAICNNISNDKCTEVSITYIDNYKLAKKIKDIIKEKTGYNVLMSKVNIGQDSDTEYDRNVVVVLVLQ